jgi:hypothetical protein
MFQPGLSRARAFKIDNPWDNALTASNAIEALRFSVFVLRRFSKGSSFWDFSYLEKPSFKDDVKVDSGLQGFTFGVDGLGKAW